MEDKFDSMFGSDFDIEEWAESKEGGMRYLRELEAWGNSDSVRAK